MDGDESLTIAERELLMAAAIQGLGPDADFSRAHTIRLVARVLQWRGRTDEEIHSGWDEPENLPVNYEVYDTLVRMVHKPSAPLFEGYGYWGVPGDPNQPACWPYYNCCRLAAHGERVARELLSQYPEYRSR